MPSEKSARSSQRKRVINRRIRTATRTTVAKAIAALEKGYQEAESNVTQAIQALDKAATKGIVHGNNTARKKSRLMAKLNALKKS